MKLIVAIKRVVDHNVQIRVRTDETGIELTNTKMAMNPFCEIAVEEAIRLKEKGIVTEVIAITVGTIQSQEQLRSALALGVDRAILVETTEKPYPLQVAKILQKVVQSENAKLILLGKQAIDDDNNQTGQMLAALLDAPQATFASTIDIKDNKALVTREIDGGLQTLQLTLPAVITTDLRLNEPRFPKLPNIVAAKKKPIDIKTPADFGVVMTGNITTLKVTPPAERQSGIKVASVDELIDHLKHVAKVI